MWVFIFVLLGVAACSYSKDMHKSANQRQELRAELDKARQAMASQDYHQAGNYYWRAARQPTLEISNGKTETISLSETERREALDGVCLSARYVNELETARGACQEAVGMAGSTSQPILDEIHRELRQRYGREIEEALGAAQPEVAKQKLLAYRRLPDTKPARLSEWEERLIDAEQIAKRREEQETRERAKRLDEAARRAREQLEEKWGRVHAFNDAMLRAWLLSLQTTVGAQFFSDVDIAPPFLRLWVADADRLSAPANLSTFADIADAFVVWCRCDGMTSVGIDMRHLGGRQDVVFTYQFNRNYGRSQLR